MEWCLPRQYLFPKIIFTVDLISARLFHTTLINNFTWQRSKSVLPANKRNQHNISFQYYHPTPRPPGLIQQSETIGLKAGYRFYPRRFRSLTITSTLIETETKQLVYRYLVTGLFNTENYFLRVFTTFSAFALPEQSMKNFIPALRILSHSNSRSHDANTFHPLDKSVAITYIIKLYMRAF